MKKVGEYTCRGSILESETPHRIQLFDGRFDTALRVTSFVVTPEQLDDAAEDVSGKLLTIDSTESIQRWYWGVNSEIAWAVCENRVASSPSLSQSWIDPDNLIVEDLYFYAHSTSDAPVNYMITFDKYEISDWQGALAMVRNRSQT
jgi:hypothetical protein